MRISTRPSLVWLNVQRSLGRYLQRYMSHDLRQDFNCCSSFRLFSHTCLILQARRIIAVLSQDFIFDGCTILVHGFSRVVLEVLKTAAQSKKLFRVFCTGFFFIMLSIMLVYVLNWKSLLGILYMKYTDSYTDFGCLFCFTYITTEIPRIETSKVLFNAYSVLYSCHWNYL